MVYGGSAQTQNDSATTEKAKPVTPWAKPAAAAPADERGMEKIGHDLSAASGTAAPRERDGADFAERRGGCDRFRIDLHVDDRG